MVYIEGVKTTLSKFCRASLPVLSLLFLRGFLERLYIELVVSKMLLVIFNYC